MPDDADARVVIVGAGQAGAAAAAKLRALGHQGPVTLVGREPQPPYQRPPLSKKYLLGELALERLYLKATDFYETNGIDLVTGTEATAIDREAREVVTGAGRLSYDRVILATGAAPRRLPAAIGGDLSGVYTVRDLLDVDTMAPEFAEGRRALIVGGGYIGLEAAAVARSRGLEVTLVEMAPRILSRVASAATADWFRALHEARGVAIREGVGLDRLEGEGRVTAALLSDGTRIGIDFVIAGIGIHPDTRLAEAAGLAIENGIAVDGACRTSDPAIFAAGDCASFPWEEGRIRLESVQNAIDQAEHAAAVIAGATGAPYRPVPWFWSDQYDARLQIAGLNLGHDRVVTRPGSREGALSVWYFHGPRFLAVDAMNEPKAFMQGKRWLQQGASPDSEALADPGRDLKTLV